MSILSSLRDTFSPSASAPSGGRRQFFRRAVGAGAAAVGSSLLLPDEAWAGVEERANAFGIVPGTTVGPNGRRIRASQFDPMIGQIVMFGGNFAPRSWALCEGQLLAINSNQALFSILGTTYGGDGRTTFGLPDLRGRAPIQQGNGAGLPSYNLGQRGGNYETTLTVGNLASHNHNPQIHGGAGTTINPISNAMAVAPAGQTIYGNVPQAAQTMAPTTNTGGNQSFSNQPPYLAVNFIIALFGTFPSRN